MCFTYRLEIEVGRVAILAGAGEQVQVEVAHEPTALALVVPDAKDLDIFVPDDVASLASGRNLFTILTGNLDENKTKQLFEYLQHALNGRLQGKVLSDQLLIQRVILLEHEAVVEPVVPQIVAAIEGLAARLEICFLELQQSLNLFVPSSSQTRPQVS